MLLKIIVWVLPAIIAIGSLYLNKPGKPKLAVILTILIIISVFSGIVLELKDNQSKKQQQDEIIAQNKYSRELLENLVTNKYEKDLQSKYPGGYTLFGIDHSRTFENRSIPHRSNVLEEYEFDWHPVKISEVTETNVTIEFPNIHYKLLNGNFFSTAMTIPKSPKGTSYRYPVRPEGTKNRIFCELVEYKDSFYVFAIGFKPADN
ncbi:MAG: hypothetical protein WC770_00665 [Phycisphaerae bacterium]|jgi:hypothetical protein